MLVTLPLVGRYYDTLFRQDPQKALSLIGKVVLPVAVLVPIQYAMPNAASWAVIGVPVQVLLLTAFSMIGPILTTVAPYRLRGMVTAVGGLYVFFVGAFGGAVLAAVLDSLFDVRTAVLIIMIPSTLIGALLIIRSADFIKNDLSLVVVEIQEEMEEHTRQQANPADIPVLALSGIDFSYGHVQILFGVNFEVKREKSWPSSAPTGPASRPHSGWPRASRRPAGAWSGSTARTSPTRPPSSAPGWASTCSRAARASSAR